MNRSAIHAATALVMATTGISFGAAAADGNPLDGERWKSRPLVVVAPRADDPMLVGVRNALSTAAMRDAFVDREMVLFTVVAGEARRNDQPLPKAQATALLAALSLKADGPATAVLVGKDGGAKLRQQGHVDFSEIMPTIDAMPMRRR